MTHETLSAQGRATIEALARALKTTPEALPETEIGARLAAFAKRRAPYGIGPDDPVRAIKTRVGDRWCSLILQVLGMGTLGHAQLRRVVGAMSNEGSISQRMLTLRLRELERDGLVQRTVSGSVPPRVDYALTDLGQGLVVQMMQLIGWIEAEHDRVLKARERFDAENRRALPGRW